MFKRLAVLSLFFTLSLPLAAIAAQQEPAQQPPPDAPAQGASATSSVPPSGAVTARFSTFLSQVLSGKTPSGNVSEKLKTGLTPQLVAQLRGSVASYGTFRRLEFLSRDTIQNYDRYRYVAVFDSGKQGFLFVTDSSGQLVGFFEGPSQ
jgi:hypothetical protein